LEAARIALEGLLAVASIETALDYDEVHARQHDVEFIAFAKSTRK
jgi:hypothetical protein